MSAGETHRPSPVLAAVARAQLRLIVGSKPRGMWIALAIVVAQIIAAAAGGILFGITIQSGHDQPARVLFTKVSDFANDLDFALDEGAVAVAVAGVAALVWAFFWPFRVWREERPQKRDYHWAMPVDRRTHDLVRVGAGLALLPVVVAIFVALAVATAAAFGHTAVFPGWGGLFWLNLFAAPLVIYLLVSIPVVGSRHPSAWIWGTLGACAALLSLLQAFGLTGLMASLLRLFLGRFGLFTVLGGSLVSEIAGRGSQPPGPWALAWLCWLALAATGVWLAASRRHRSI
jgi:MFS family permease